MHIHIYTYVCEGICLPHSLTFNIFHNHKKTIVYQWKKLHDSSTKVIFNSVRQISCSINSKYDQLIHTLNGYGAEYNGLPSLSLSYYLKLPDKFIWKQSLNNFLLYLSITGGKRSHFERQLEYWTIVLHKVKQFTFKWLHLALWWPCRKRD